MQSSLTKDRPFIPGSIGWTASDLADPEIERLWFGGRYEIVEGVLASMPPAYFAGGTATYNLMRCLDRHLEEQGIKGKFATEVDVVIDEHRVVRADAVLMLEDDVKRQKAAAKGAGRRDPKRTPILVPPTLVIESVSPGHEEHDRRVKKRWYAEFGVANYWLLNAFEQTLECLRLKGGKYVSDGKGKGRQTVRPGAFVGLGISLGSLWEDEE